MGDLTPKQKVFVDEYLVDLNATRAATVAGYAAKSASVEGVRLLGNAKVAAVIGQAMDARAKRTEITQDRVLKELARIGFSDMRKLLKWTGNNPQMDLQAAEDSGEIEISVANFVQLFDSDELDDDTAACISEISQTKDGALKVKLYDKRAALVDIARHLGMFVTKVEHSGSVDVNHKAKADADDFVRSISSLAARMREGSASSDTQH
jgi:phage terminase small subunit